MNSLSPRPASRFTLGAAALAGHLRSHWLLYLPVGAIWVLACVRVLVDPTPRIPLLFNWTPSLPYTVAVLHDKRQPLQRGDYIVYAFDGEAQRDYPGLRGQPFFKRVVGLPGDQLTVSGREVAVNGQVIGWAKTHTHDRRPLDPISPGPIPPGHYFVAGTNPDSFDSRYRASGLVRSDQVLGTVAPLF